MIVLTAGPASLARLMRRDDASQHLAPRQMDDHQAQGPQPYTPESNLARLLGTA